jgi:hypothetical protein
MYKNPKADTYKAESASFELIYLTYGYSENRNPEQTG